MTSYELQFVARCSVLYHRKRQAFLEGWDMAAKVLALVSSAVIVAMEKIGTKAAAAGWVDLLPSFPFWVAVLTGTVSMIVVVGGASRKAVQHSVLAGRWADLLLDVAEIEGGAEAPVPVAVQKKSAAIARDELPELGALVRLCHREVMQADGFPASEIPAIPGHHEFFAQWYDFPTPPRKPVAH